MKKSLLLVLLLGLLLVFAGCAGEEGTVSEDGAPADVEKAPDPEAPISEEVMKDMAAMTDALGISVGMEGYQIDRCAVIDEIQAHVEFLVNDADQGMGRVAKGQQQNMSGVTSAFDNTETVDINGVSAQLRYPNPGKETLYAAETIGIADAYDAAKDLSYSVVIMTNAAKEDLTAALTALMNGTTVQ